MTKTRKKKRKSEVKRQKPKKFEKKKSGPNYMVQIGDPKALRRDLLETLRELIILMQSYEKFKIIQEAKVNYLNTLKTDVKELNLLIEKLKKFFPQGKLKAVTKPEFKLSIEKRNMEAVPQPQQMEREMPGIKEPGDEEESTAPTSIPPSTSKPRGDIDELEAQLRDIEGQLKRIQ